MTKTSYIFCISIAALYVGVVLSGCTPKPPAGNTPEAKTASAAPTVTPTVVRTGQAKDDPHELKEVPATLTIYVPVQSAKLERREVKGKLYNAMPTGPSTYASVVAEQSLSLLFAQAPQYFPRGTKLTAFPEVKDGTVMYVSLSRQFAEPRFWDSKNRTGKAKATLAIYALVNTAAEGWPLPDNPNPLRVQILIDGKTIPKIANVHTAKPLRPRHELVANNRAKRNIQAG